MTVSARSILAAIVLSAVRLEAGEADPAAPAAERFGLHRFAPPGAGSRVLAESGTIKTEPILADDIAGDFGNIADLAWLEPHAARSRALLFGENHYYRYIHHVRNRVYFALNIWDAYPVLILEAEFSKSAYAAHCLAMAGDREAEAFARSFLAVREDVDLLLHVRRWNRTHPDRRLAVAFSDIEHGRDTGPLIGFLRKADPAFRFDPAGLDYGRFRAAYPELKRRIDDARGRGLSFPIPEADADHHAAVLENLHDTFKAYHFRDEAFNLYRQKAIVRNLTDPRFLGKLIEGRKFMLHGGLYHMQRANDFPDGYNFLHEGSFLEHEQPSTKGKTFALSVFAVGYSLDAMAGKDPAELKGYGSGYLGLLGQLRKAYEAGAIGPDDHVSQRPIRGHEQVLSDIASAGNHRALRVAAINWDALSLLAKALPALRGQLEGARGQFSGFDGYIFIPRSPMVELLPKAPQEPARPRPAREF